MHIMAGKIGNIGEPKVCITHIMYICDNVQPDGVTCVTTGVVCIFFKLGGMRQLFEFERQKRAENIVYID